MDKKTKIVTTIGPASDSEENMTRLLELGVNVFRFNMKHNTVEWHEERIKRADKISKKLGLPLGILVDLQGPEIRLETRDKQPVSVKKGEPFRFVDSLKDPSDLVCLPHDVIFSVAKVGGELLIDDGFQEFDITSVTSDTITAVPREDYTIANRKGVNFPGLDISLPSLIDADLEKLDLATRSKVDFVALSFCRSAADIRILHEEMAKRKVDAAVIAKIESRQALDNFDEILEASDGIMVARGDLGVEIPYEELAFWQKQLVYRCRIKHKPVIVATQMLQSMTDNPRPTRAEVTDVGNAIWDGTDAIMLSSESASGKYPLKAVETMARIATFNESKCFVPELPPHASDSTVAMAAAGLAIVEEHSSVSPDAIIVFTQSGYTARVVSSFRPKVPVIAVSNSQKTVEELSLSYGINPIFHEFPPEEFHVPHRFINSLIEKGHLKQGQLVLLVHGRHWGQANATNAISLLTI